MDSDRFDRLEALLSAKLDAQTQQVAELQKEVALLRTAVQANAGASTAQISSWLLETTTVPGQLALFGSLVRSYYQQMRSLVS